MTAKLRKVVKQPSVSSQGNRKLPNVEPVLPNIISKETTIVLELVVG